jgi:hypothetical protein
MQYTIAAIPTFYNGTQFRSRLEARWAAFFDLVGWQWEYEPFDLGAWSPDFLLKGEYPTLVEIKPIDNLDAAVGAKMLSAVRDTTNHILLLCGIGPYLDDGEENVGWTNSPHGTWCPAMFTGDSFCSYDDFAPNGLGQSPSKYRSAQKAWREAGNRVQWRRR